MRRFTLKPNLMIIIALLAACLVLAACGDSRAENPQSERTGVVKVESREFVNEQLLAENPLFIPPLLEPRLENGEKVFDLAVQAGETEFFEGKRTETLGFNGDYLGPTLRAHAGDRVRLNVTNDLAESTTVHWHGMHLPAAMDGGPHQVIQPGQTWQPHWAIKPRPHGQGRGCRKCGQRQP